MPLTSPTLPLSPDARNPLPIDTESKGHPRELWVQVQCTDRSDQLELAQRFRLGGRTVELITIATPRDFLAGVNSESN